MATRIYRVKFCREYGAPLPWSDAWVSTIEAKDDEDVRIQAFDLCVEARRAALEMTYFVAISKIEEIVGSRVTREVGLTEKERRGSRAA